MKPKILFYIIYKICAICFCQDIIVTMQNGRINLTKTYGQEFQIMTDALNNAFGDPFFTQNKNYNCWGASLALMRGEKLYGNGPDSFLPWGRDGVGLNSPGLFDLALNYYTPVKQEAASVGKTIMRFGSPSFGATTHASIFLGVDISGNEYTFSKNGWFARPVVYKSKLLNYGSVIGRTPKESGYYGKSNFPGKNVYTLIYCLLFDSESDSFPVFKYLSPQDTIILFSSDFINIREGKTNIVYNLSDDAVEKISAINNMEGHLYYYLKNDNIWVYVKFLDYYAQYIPYGYHVATYNNTFLIDNHYILFGHRIPSVMLKSKDHIKQRYKRMLKRPYTDSQFYKINYKNNIRCKTSDKK